jgi:hypothetical protein
MIVTRGKGRPPKKVVVEEGCDPESIYNSNKLNAAGGQRLLLVLLFASDEELRLLLMHPEFLAADTTNKTNKENKELFTIKVLMVAELSFHLASSGCFITSSRTACPFFGVPMSRRGYA